MREILFRGKRTDNEEWVYGDLLSYWRIDKYIIRTFDKSIHEYIFFEVIPETVGQYTELKDKNGEKIFEGDFVRIWGGECWYGIREYNKIVLITDCYSIIDICEAENIKIIGNKWDNPELLKEKR